MNNEEAKKEFLDWSNRKQYDIPHFKRGENALCLEQSELWNWIDTAINKAVEKKTEEIRERLMILCEFVPNDDYRIYLKDGINMEINKTKLKSPKDK